MRLVPNNRLILWTGGLFIPGMLLAVLVPAAGPVCYGGLVGFMLLVGLDVVLSHRLLRSVQVLLPEIVRLTREKDGCLGIQIHSQEARPRALRLGLPFPRQIVSPYPDIEVDLDPEGSKLSLQWPCKALQRGHYDLANYYLEINSRIGFWALRGTFAAACQIRVYPDLRMERQTLAALFMQNNLGIHSHRQIGKGRDFEQLREYVPGDSFEDIHWKATAKRGIPISKVYQIERTQKVYIILDASRLAARNAAIFHSGRRGDRRVSEKQGGGNRLDTILERFIAASLTIGMAAERQGDNFGIVTFADQVRGFLRAKNGRAHYQSCREMLCLLESERVTPDFAELFMFLGTKIRKRSLLIFLTSLDDPAMADGFLKHIDMLRRHHLLMVNMLKPAAANPLFASQVHDSVNDIYHHLAGHFLWDSLDQTARTLRRAGVGFSLLDNERLGPQLITQYLNIKQRQLL